jgi:ferredoxin
MKPHIDHELCTGCQLCSDICPDVFKMGEDDLAHVIDENPPEELHELVQECIESCPASCISDEDAA